MKDYKVIFRYAVGYGANFRFIGLKRSFIVSAENKDTAPTRMAEKLIDSAEYRPSFYFGLNRGWIMTVKPYTGQKITKTTIDLRNK